MAKEQNNGSEQMELPLITHRIEEITIFQRAQDGYIDATAMCKKAGKDFYEYSRRGQTKEFIEALSADTEISRDGLIQSIKGGIPELQGTWIHPQVAIHLAQWLSPTFSVLVSRWVLEWMAGKTSGKMPYHLERYMANRGEIPHTHFSVLNEITFALIAPLESEGYTLSEKLWPDISQGRMFSGWLKKQGIDPSEFPTYTHVFSDGRPSVQARLYPNKLLADFRKHFHEVWLPQRSESYFAEKDPTALPYLPDVIKFNQQLPLGYEQEDTKE